MSQMALCQSNGKVFESSSVCSRYWEMHQRTTCSYTMRDTLIREEHIIGQLPAHVLLCVTLPQLGI